MDFASLFSSGERQVEPEQAPAALAEPAAAPSSPGFMDKLKTDPSFAQAALIMGARLMQGPKPGQDALGSIGDAVMMGTQAHSMFQQNNEKMAMQKAESAAKIGQMQSQTASTKAGTEGKVLENASEKALSEDKIKSYRMKVDALARQEDVAKARAGYDKLKASFLSTYANDPNSDVKKLWTQELQNPILEAQGNLAAKNAQTAYYQASAAQTREKTANPEKFQPNYSGKQNIAPELIKQAHPDWSDQKIAQEVLDLRTGKKGESVEVLKELANSNKREHRDYAVNRMYELAKKGDPSVEATSTPAQEETSQKPRIIPRATGAALLPRDQRHVGYQYNGMSWTGTGWLPVGSKK